MKFLKDADIKNRIVLLRVDFNVTVEEGRVTEDFRMRASLPTIRHLIDNEAKKVLIISHYNANISEKKAPYKTPGKCIYGKFENIHPRNTCGKRNKRSHNRQHS